MLPVAPFGTGQPPSSPNEDSNDRTPALERGDHVREPLPARVVEVGGQLDVVAQALARGGEELADLARVGHAGGVAERDLRAARRDQPLGDVEDALGRHVRPRRDSRTRRR